MAAAITVIGAGMVGVATAIHLQQRGYAVTLVDRREPGRETSFGNAGVINPCSMVPLNNPDLHKSLAGLLSNRRAALRYDAGYLLKNLGWVLGFLEASKTRAATHSAHALASLTLSALVEHRALMQRSGNLHRLSEVGWLKVFRGEQGHDPASFAGQIFSELGMPIQEHDADSLRELEPALKPIFHSGIVMPGGAIINNPGALIAEHAAMFAADGGEFRMLDVQSIGSSESGLHYKTPEATVACEHLVIAAGPWSGDLLASAGWRVPLGVERGYHAHYEPSGHAVLGRSVHDVEAGYVIGPMEHGLRVTTGVELAHRDAPANLTQLEQVEPRVREAIALGPRTEQPVWRGARPTLPDSRPAIGAVPGAKNLWVNFGHQHIGLMTGPISGRLLAELINNEKPAVDPSPFAPGRCIHRQTRRLFRRR